LQFQTDPEVRVAMLGITAAGVAVTLTASSTVWFAELFWTPAIMIQAEDRCHRIGQQARVRCLYFIGKGTLDEVLWKLIEKKFCNLGEFVDGKENLGIALERELEDDEHDEILKSEDNEKDKKNRKRKSQDVFCELLDTEDLELNNEIDDLIHKEEDMLNIQNEEEEDEPDVDEKMTSVASTIEQDGTGKNVASTFKAVSSKEVLELSDDEDIEIKSLTMAQVRKRYRECRIITALKIDPQMEFNNIRVYTGN
jgi:SWI/SNF-related matrix-associated actin-dependent regulator 1 of chromatin subfamily A